MRKQENRGKSKKTKTKSEERTNKRTKKGRIHKRKDKMAKEKMASSVDNKWYYGYDSIFLIFRRIPVFWVFVPLLYLLKTTKNIKSFEKNTKNPVLPKLG